MNAEINALIEVVEAQQKTIDEITKASAAIGAAQFLIFRLLMQYDEKLAAAFASALEREVIKNKQHPSPYHPYYDGQIDELLNIAHNPTQRDEKGRPSWIRLVTDDKESH